MTLKTFEYMERDGRVVPCSWCMKEQGALVPEEPGGVSHGICPAHSAAMLRELRLSVGRDADGVARLIAHSVEFNRGTQLQPRQTGRPQPVLPAPAAGAV